jgi:hypothetical protein
MMEETVMKSSSSIFSVLAAFFLCVSVLPVSAEGISLDLDDARALALENSRSLAKYNLTVRSSVLDERGQI